MEENVSFKMTPITTTATQQSGSVFRWNSSVAYVIVGGVIVMLSVISSCALIILACFYNKFASSSSFSSSSSTTSSKLHLSVVMPGDINPSYLATPTVLPLTSNIFNSNAHTSSDGRAAGKHSSIEPSPSPSSLRVDSPMIYWFVGIGTMLALVLVAMLIVAYSRWRRRSAPDVGGRDHSHKVARHVYDAGDEANVTPEIVVFMPGDKLPTYLAEPVHTSGTTHLSDTSL
ncbi:uncharacterized protein LOC112515007 [Cynara cardunculus var. scolymus]|uniref:uncharacterized protein LOC112515007 n=1 Tax=Cynara cardunculus var. scolymus TaxID=59895 RepID=UPI000D62AD18|nr:uncharacterized protein LOC112515007 [Cynara cardunculus var. scolymus]